jgi:hypothetical protein
MVRFSLVTALCAAVVSAVDFDKIAVGKGHSRLPGAYIFEFEENHVRIVSSLMSLSITNRT